jgi:hypothetical protein
MLFFLKILVIIKNFFQIFPFLKVKKLNQVGTIQHFKNALYELVLGFLG